MFRRRRSIEGLVRQLQDALPVGIYVVDAAGKFRLCNRVARVVFGIPEDASDLSAWNIADFYSDPQERQHLLYEMRKHEGKRLDSTISLTVDGNEKIVFDSCADLEGQLALHERGCIGVVTDITESAVFQKLLSELPIAIYEVDESNALVRGNQQVRDLFRIPRSLPLEGLDVSTFYADDADLDRLLDHLRRTGRADNWILDMVRIDGSDFIAQLTSRSKVIDGRRTGRFGAVVDASEAQEYVRALEALPSGYYRVEEKGQREVITRCNPAFAEILGYGGKSDLIGKVDTLSHYAESAAYDAFRRALAAAHSRGRALSNYRIEIQRKDGSRRWISVNCRVLERNGHDTGREGTISDVTQQVKLEADIRGLEKELTRTLRDMDHFMHRYVAPIMRIDAALTAQGEALAALSPDTAEWQASAADSFASQWAEPLERSFEAARLALEDLRPTSDWLVPRFLEAQRTLGMWRSQTAPVMAGHVVRKAAVLAARLLSNRRAGEEVTAAPEVDELRTMCRQAIHAALIQSTKRQRAETGALNTVIESLRHYLFRQEVLEYDFSPADLGELLQGELETYAPLATAKGLEFRYESTGDLNAQVADTHIRRMFSNLLLNAIKYSYRRPHGYIGVSIEGTADQVRVEMSNYGVPIQRGELESGRIFEYGERGKLSKDHNRTGSGVGLADVSMTLRMHRGTISISSFPATPGHDPEDYSVPFLTLVEVSLPK